MRTFLRFAAIAYVAYIAIALLIITPALNILPHRYVQDNYDRELHTGWVLFNPFKISLDVSEAELTDDKGERFAALSEASVNLSLESLWHAGWVLDTVKIHDLYLNLERISDTEFNFSDLMASETEAPPPPEPDTDPVPGITIRDLDIHSETIVLTDNSRARPYNSRWNGLSIRVKDLSTVIEEGQPYSIDLFGEAGGELHWRGTVSIPKRVSEGELSTENLYLPNLWRLAEPWLNFELKDGRMAVSGRYSVDWNDDLLYQINEGAIGFTVIDIVPKAPEELPDTSLGLSALNIGEITVNSTTQEVAIDAITIDALNVASWREGAGISLEQLFAVNLPADETDAEEEPEGKPWRVALNRAQLLNGRLHWRSQLTDPPILDVVPIEATVEKITWPLAGETELSLSLSVNEQANIAANGTLALAEGSGSIAYTLDGLPLSWFNPNLPEALKAEISDGQVQVAGQVALAEYAPTTIALGGEIVNFSARFEDADVPLTGWDSVRFEGLAVDMLQHSLLLEKLAINSYTGRIHIWEDGSINASNVWKEEVGEQAEQVAEELTEEKPWSINLPSIVITDSEIDFMDQSLPITFRTVIGELEGEVLNISSEPGAAAEVDIKGSVDGYAPVALVGSVAPFAATTFMDLELTFDSVDMALLSPYSGTYAGYAIEQGLLDLDLQYALKDNQLQGKNAIRIDQLKLGEKVSSDKAVDLPLELALAILTDSNGVIDMKVPITGDVDDPGFQLGGVIGQAFLNILTKAITAPFNLLASLVDTEEDLQRITFASGSAQLNDASKEKLTQLASALEQRPQLSLVITGRLNLAADRERIQKNALKVQLLEEGLSAEEIKTKGPEWEKAINDRYQSLAEVVPETDAPSALEQYSMVAQSIEVPEQQLIEMGQERSVTVKRYLLSEAGLAPERAVIGQATLDEEANEFSGVELGIEN